MYLTSAWGLAKTHQTEFYFHATCPDPCKELGQPVALRLFEKLADRGEMALEHILKIYSFLAARKAECRE